MASASVSNANHGGGSRDTGVLEDLYEALEREPNRIDIHELLVDIWTSTGDLDMAYGVAETLIRLDPDNDVAMRCLQLRNRGSGPETQPLSPAEVQQMEKTLTEGYRELRLQAEILKIELSAPCLRDAIDNDKGKHALAALDWIGDGKISSVAAIDLPPPTTLTVSTASRNPELATEVIADDFKSVVRWMEIRTDGPLDPDAIRQRVTQRRRHYEAALPDALARPIRTAFQLMERDCLGQTYANHETMYGDPVTSIPAARFFVSADNYAFDMAELACAIAAQHGVLRNPLSRHLFPPDDADAILAHPLGRALAPLRDAQERWRQRGVTAETVVRVAALGTALLADRSADGTGSRAVTAAFRAFVAGRPAAERATLERLRVPARDRHTGQPFDYSVLEAVEDARAGATCYHKVGDFLTQAATFLRSQLPQ